MEKFKVSEVFYSIQGEGVSRGTPAVFIRFPHCNLNCMGKDWQCDSFGLRNVFKLYTPQSLLLDILKLDPNMLDYLKDQRVHIVYTGGEPGMEENALAINQFRAFIFNEVTSNIVDEMETNGSIDLTDKMTPYGVLLNTMSIVNCSPKLESSGNSLETRFNESTLRYINEIPQSYFKFVVNDMNDLHEIDKQFDFINDRKIILMPATLNTACNMEADPKWKQFVWEYASQKGWKYSGRDHIDVWGDKTGI